MPNTREINIGMDRFNNKEAVRIFLAIMLMFILQISANTVEADDSTNDVETSISLIVDANANDSFIESAIVDANELANTGLTDVEQTNVLEQNFATLTINIGNGVNVRNIDAGDDFGNTDSSFPRGNTDVIGWFNSTGTEFDNIPGGRGTWLVLEGGEHAVFSGAVNELDGSAVTDDEATTTQEYEFDGTQIVPVQPEVEAEPAPEPDDDDADEVTTPEPGATGTPEAILGIPELPDSFEVSWTINVAGERVMSEPVTIEINRDSLLPVPLGLIEAGQFESVDQFTAHIESRLSSGGEQLTQSALSGILVDVTQDPNGPWMITIAFPTNDGGWGTMNVNALQNFYVRPVDEEMNSLDPADEFFSLSSDTRMTEEGIIIDERIPIGSNIIISFYDPPVDATNNLSLGSKLMCSGLTPTPAIEMIQDGGSCEFVSGGQGLINSDLGGIIYNGE